MKKLIAICGKSASGKDSFLRAIVNTVDSVKPIISYTTRPKRENEIEGKDYYFITKEEMADKIVKGEMLEVSEFNDWFYGTAFESLSDDKINIGVYNLNGIEYLQEYSDIQLTTLYIDADDKVRLLRALNREAHPNVDEIVRRYQTDKEDFSEERIAALKPIVLKNNCIEDFDCMMQTFKNLDFF